MTEVKTTPTVVNAVPESRICRGCHVDKLLTDYYSQTGAKGKTYYRLECKQCHHKKVYERTKKLNALYKQHKQQLKESKDTKPKSKNKIEDHLDPDTVESSEEETSDESSESESESSDSESSSDSE